VRGPADGYASRRCHSGSCFRSSFATRASSARSRRHAGARDPHTLLNPGYFDEPTIRADLEAVGFRDVSIDRIARPWRAASARDAVVITVEGSLLRTAIEAADPSRLGEATDAVERIMRTRFGEGLIEGTNKALVVTTTKPQ
jgi:hypothetical protein